MAFFDNFPYTNFHRLNLDWVIEKIKTLTGKVDSIDETVQEEINQQLPGAIQDAIDSGALTYAYSRRIVIISDSYGEGYNPDSIEVTAFPAILKNLLNIPDEDYFSFNKGGMGFYAAEGNQYAVDNFLNSIAEQINNRDSITDIIFALGYNDGAQAYANIQDGISRTLALVKSLFTFPHLNISLFAIGYHASNEAQRGKLGNVYAKCYAASGMAYTKLTPAICDKTWWASDGYHPLQNAQTMIARQMANILMGGNMTAGVMLEEFATTDKTNITLYSQLQETGIRAELYGQYIPESNIELTKNTPVKILTVTSDLPLANAANNTRVEKWIIPAIVRTSASAFYQVNLFLYFVQESATTYGLYATILNLNAAGNNYLSISNVNQIEFETYTPVFNISYNF